MEPIRQEDKLGCAVACVAFILNIDYKKALKLFASGERKAKDEGFYCKEIIMAFNNLGFGYQYKYTKKRLQKKIYKENTIVFIKRCKRYPKGHYLTRFNNKWMDPWINFPKANIRAGFRKRLPGTPIYLVFQTKD